MSNSVQGINKQIAGTCPHGCSPAACPICSGMGGGGSRPGERAQKPGEMSYHQCAMLGALMRAREARIETHEKNLINHSLAVKNFENKLIQISENLANIAAKLSQNILTKPISFGINKILLPILNNIKNIPQNFKKIFEKFDQIKTNIQDKLNAIFGEEKAAILKKISDIASSVKLKIENIFKIFKRNNTKDDETKIDEDKKIFRLKNFIKKFIRRKHDSEDKSES